MARKMPVFVLQAKDIVSLEAIDAYRQACARLGLADQAREVGWAYEEFLVWQDANRDKLKYPDHKHVPAEEE